MIMPVFTLFMVKNSDLALFFIVFVLIVIEFVLFTPVVGHGKRLLVEILFFGTLRIFFGQE